MLRRWFLIIVLSFLIEEGEACLWINGTTIDGDYKRTIGVTLAKRLKESIKTTPQARYHQLVKNRTGRIEAQDWSDQEIEGVKAIIDGNLDEAIQTFLEIEETHPGVYSTAANLGTAYELKGDLIAARDWIRESIQRNAEAHMGTEWLHLAILDAKLQLIENPSYLTNHRIVPFPDDGSHVHQIEVMGEVRSLEDVRTALEYQLGERMVFVKPPDPVVADLLFTLALIEANTVVVESGMQMFALAESYGFADRELIWEKTEDYESIIRNRKIRYWGLIGLGVLVAVWAIVFALRKNWIQLSAKSRPS